MFVPVAKPRCLKDCISSRRSWVLRQTALAFAMSVNDPWPLSALLEAVQNDSVKC